MTKYQELKEDVLNKLELAFGREYARKIPDETVEAIADDVTDTSDFYAACRWNDTDIQYAMARVLLPKEWTGEW